MLFGPVMSWQVENPFRLDVFKHWNRSSLTVLQGYLPTINIRLDDLVVCDLTWASVVPKNKCVVMTVYQIMFKYVHIYLWWVSVYCCIVMSPICYVCLLFFSSLFRGPHISRKDEILIWNSYGRRWVFISTSFHHGSFPSITFHFMMMWDLGPLV